MVSTNTVTASLAVLVSAFAFFAVISVFAETSGTLTELSIRRITPVGDDVPAANQIVIEFNRPVVPLGRMERTASELPISITPELNCKWRWINRQALACNLDEQDRMAEATRYTITVNPGIKAMDGASIAKVETHEFTTRRPNVSATWFKTWKAPGVPVLRMIFNQPVTKQSVEDSLTLTIESGDEPVSIKAAPDPDDRELPRFIGIPGEKLILDFGGQAKQKSDAQLTITPEGQEARRVWLVEPVNELELDRKITLHLKAGLVSAFGSEKGIAREQVIEFHTFPEFSFLGVRCTNNDGRRILITPGEQDIENPKMMCNPFAGVALSFSTPVLKSQIKREIVLDPDLAGGREDYDPWANQSDRSRLRSPHRKDATYDIRLPEKLRAFQRYGVRSREVAGDLVDTVRSRLADLPQTNLHDEFGRTLTDKVDLSFWTNHRKPNFELIHHDAVLESAIDSEVPLYVTNLNEVRFDYRLVGEDGAKEDLSLTFRPPKVEDVAFAVPMGAREMTGGKTGAVFGSIASSPPVSAKSHWDRRFFTQVTPYQVHAKVGHFNTLVWVTDLETGQAVPDANVTLYRDALTKLGMIAEDAPSKRTDAGGVALLPGTMTLDPRLDTFGWRCNNDACEKLFIRVDGDKGMALLPLNRHYRVNVARASDYRIYLNQQRHYGHIHTWGTTAQGVYRAGDTIQFKIYVRDQNNEQFVPAPTSTYTLELKDPTGKVVHEVKDITLNEFGAFAGEYEVPATSVMGWHDFRLKADFTDRQWRPMRVLVSDFTPAAFRVKNHINGDLFRPGDTLRAETTALLHSGGAYTQAEARVTVNLSARGFSSKHPLANRFSFDTSSTLSQLQIHQEIGELTDQGTHEIAVKLSGSNIVYGRLNVESAVRDDRGKYIAAMSSADYIAVDRLVGLRKDSWVFDEDQTAEVQFITVDERGKPVDDTDVVIKIEHLVTKAARVKGAGNAYVTNFTENWEAVDECFGTPQKAPLRCRFTPEEPGRYRIVASIQDTQGRAHTTKLMAWVAGKGRVVWREDASYALDMVSEKDRYNVGDTARFLIKNPYPGARALVTLERYGVIKQWQTTLDGSTPILEFPIEAAYVPGAYLSVVVFSPRVENPPPENRNGAGQVDLGKPAFRIGYREIPVIDPYKQIIVNASTERDVYKPRDTVNVSLKATPKKPPKNREPIEYAVIVLDEAVFDLIAGGRNYFDPYKGFYSLDGLDVDNYSLLTRIVGRQKFEKKGANSGGDGGNGLTLRTIFNYVSYWNPSLKADDQGKANFHFTLPDNLTGWRVLAMAVTPTDRFGLGEVNFKTNQPTEVRPVMPNQVTEGDSFKAGFSVMNRTEKQRTLKVAVRAKGDIEGDRAEVIENITLAPYKRATVYLPVSAARLKVSRDVKSGQINFEARASDDSDGDAMAHDIPVLKRRNFEVAANYGSITNDGVTEPIAFPKEIYSDVGDVSVVLSPSVIGNAEGAFRYIRDYDYTCWEQVLTKGVMASHFNELQAYLDPSLEWPESTELPDIILKRAPNYQAPNGGMAYYIPVDQNVSPYLSAYTALAFNWLRHAGHDIPEKVEGRLHGYLLRLLRRDEVPSFYTKGMSSTVRAVALNALAEHGEIRLNDLRRHAEHLKYMDLFGAANFMDAALQFDDVDDLVRDAINRVMARSNTTGGKLTFNGEVDDSYSRILTTQLRSNCAILSAFSRVDDPDQYGLGAIPTSMIRAVTQTRGNRDHWENTQENMFCMNALIDYSRRWEDVKPDMRVSAVLDGAEIGKGLFDDFRDRTLEFSAPITPKHPGTDAQITISREGHGRLYYGARVAYSPKPDNLVRINAGIDIRREYSVLRDGEWVMLKKPAVVRRGELVRVDLFLNLPTARNFVVADDPVPGGLEPVNRDLATTSGVDAAEGDFDAAGGSWWFRFGDWISYGVSRWSFYHRETRHDAVRFYSDYLPPGRYHVSYSAQAIATGSFAIRPTHAAEMYDIDIYGKAQPMILTVEEAQ